MKGGREEGRFKKNEKKKKKKMNSTNPNNKCMLIIKSEIIFDLFISLKNIDVNLCYLIHDSVTIQNPMKI